MILALYIGGSFGLILYEFFNGGPWYTYENIFGDRIIMGQEPTTLLVRDENGDALSIVQGYAFPESDTIVTRSKDSQGEYVFTHNQPLPAWIKTVDAIFYPLLSIFRD